MYAKLYHHFNEAIGKLGGEQCNSITKPEYKVGYMMIPILLSHTQIVDSCGQSSGLNGSLKLEIKFGSTASEAMTLIAYAEYDASLCIDKSGNASTFVH